MTPDTSGLSIGRRLSAARLERGLSQGIVARQAGIAPSYLSRIETGKVQPTFRTVARVARALKVPMEQITASESLAGDKRGPCPVSRHGRCLLDLIRSETEVDAAPGLEVYSPREIRLLRRVARWVKVVPSDRLRALEILLEDLTRGARSDG